MKRVMSRGQKSRWQVPAGVVNEAYQHDGGVPGADQDINLAVYTTQGNQDHDKDLPLETRKNGPEETARHFTGSFTTLTTEHHECGVSSQAGESGASGEDSSWTVALGAAIIAMMVNMVSPCFSVIFSPLLLDLGESSTTINSLFSILLFTMCISALFLDSLLVEFGWLKVATACSILTSCAVILSAFATSAWFLLCSASILSGISLGLKNNLFFLIIPYCFTRRRGMANAFMMGGAISGMMLGPILVGFLQEELGFFGATIVFGAIILHGCVGASFFLSVKIPVYAKMSMQANNNPGAQDSHADKAMNQSRSSCSDNVLVRVCRYSVHNLSVLRSPRAVIIAVGHMLTLNSWLNFVALVPFAVQAAGHSSQTGNLCVTVMAASDLVVCLMVSTLSDLPWFNMRVCCMASTATIGVSIIAFTLVEDIQWQLVSTVMLGCGVGGYMALLNLVIAHYMGHDKMAPTLGTTFLVVGLGYITIGPSTGMIRDASGSYDASMWLLAGLAFACFVVWFFMGAAVRYDHRSGDAPPAGDP